MSTEQKAEPGVTLTAASLKELLASVIAEVRKPLPPTPEEVAKKEAALKDRKEIAEMQLLVLENRRREQEACVHMRPSRAGGGTTGVYIANGHYIICQQCQKVIRPEKEPALFNQIYQMCEVPNVF